MLFLKKFKLLFINLLIVHSAFAQNLVPNGDFEVYSILPNNYGQTNRATGWNNVNGFYSGPPYASPDYFNAAGTVPNSFGQIAPFSGNGQMGFATFVFFINDFREYISTTLVSPLVAGTQYQVSFALTNGNNGDYSKSTNNIGVCFSTGSFSQSVNQPIPANPQIEITAITSNNNVWQNYTYFFTATNAYTRITIGNFRDDANTLISSTGASGAYYFIDKIVVQAAAPLPIELLSFTGKNREGKNILQWTTASELNNEYFTLEKSSNDQRFESIGTIKGAGNSTQIESYSFTDSKPLLGTNYYRLKQTDFNGETTNSKIIALHNQPDKNIELLISPNPANNFINVLYQNPNENDEINIHNILGKIVIKSTGLNKVDVSELENGIYNVQVITNDENILNKKIIIQH